MNTLEAHGRFAALPDLGLSLLPEDLEVRPIPGLNPTAALCTAAAILSGMLDDCRTQADLEEAVQHFATLLSGEVFTLDDWIREAEDVIHLILAWGRRLMADAN